MPGDASALSLSPPRARAVPWVVVGLWLLGSTYALWFFELRYQQASAGDLTFFDAEAHSREAETWLRSLIAAGPVSGASRATVVRVLRDGCACNRAVEAQLQRIVTRYGDKGVRFVHVATGLPPWVETTPAALVFDGGGRLVYLGPVSDPAWCGAAGGLVERVLDQVLHGTSPHPQRMFVRSCHCASAQS
jgi:hypothetical protein